MIYKRINGEAPSYLKNKSKYKKVGVLPTWKVKSNVSSVDPSSERNMFLSHEGPTLETLDFTMRISSTPTYLYLDLHLNTAAYYVCYLKNILVRNLLETPSTPRTVF